MNMKFIKQLFNKSHKSERKDLTRSELLKKAEFGTKKAISEYKKTFEILREYDKK